MSKLSKMVVAGGFFFLAACSAGQSVPDQRSLDVCSERIGLSKKLTVVTDASGKQSVSVSPAGSKLSVEEAIALKKCTDNL